MAASFIASLATDFTGAADAIGGAVVLLFSAALGASIRYRQTARDQLIERAELQERELLARELHDTVAHHLSAIAIQAQAGLFLAGSSSLSGAVEALEIIEQEASQTLTELADGPNTSPSPPDNCRSGTSGSGAVGPHECVPGERPAEPRCHRARQSCRMGALTVGS